MNKSKHIGTLSHDKKTIFGHMLLGNPQPEYDRVHILQIKNEKGEVTGVDWVAINNVPVPFNFRNGILTIWPRMDNPYEC